MSQEKMNKDLEYYLSLPYTVELTPEPSGGWFVGIKELPGCMTDTDTPEAALGEIRLLQAEWLQFALEDGFPIPEPRPKDQYSGSFRLRLPRWLHRTLVEEAEKEGVSLNTLCNTMLAQAVGHALVQPGSHPQRRSGRKGEAEPVQDRSRS